jgi:hypothetical protein
MYKAELSELGKLVEMFSQKVYVFWAKMDYPSFKELGN